MIHHLKNIQLLTSTVSPCLQHLLSRRDYRSFLSQYPKKALECAVHSVRMFSNESSPDFSLCLSGFIYLSSLLPLLVPSFYKLSNSLSSLISLFVHLNLISLTIFLVALSSLLPLPIRGSFCPYICLPTHNFGRISFA